MPFQRHGIAQNKIYRCHQVTSIVTLNVGNSFSGEVVVWERKEGGMVMERTSTCQAWIFLHGLIPWGLKLLAFLQVIYKLLRSTTP